MLASDLANPEFVNPQNPDRFLAVEFFFDEPLDKNKTEEASGKAGKYVAIREPKGLFIRISKPGDRNLEIVERVREDHKARFPDHWKAFEIREGLRNEDIPGWKIEEWEAISPEELKELKYLRFFTVEQIAAASDAQCQGMGMAGMSLRVRARDALKNRIQNMVDKANREKDAELAAMRAEMAELRAMLLKPSQPKADPQAPKAIANEEREALAKQYEEKFGKKPHHKLSAASIKEKLAEAA